MKRGPIIALTILLVLVGVYFLVQEEPQRTIDSPLKLEKVEDLNRIEITPASGGGDGDQKGQNEEESASAEKPDLIALEKKNGDWWLTRPVESPAAADVGETIGKQLEQTIRTDDIKLSPDNASDYKVDDEQGVRVALYGKKGSSPVHELVVGKQMSVPGTGVERTYVRQAGSKKIYRAQTAIGDFVRQSVEDFRSKTILDLKKKSISRVEFKHRNGETIVLAKKDKNWTILRPEVDFDVDGGEVESIVGALASLNASSFAPDEKLSDLGLEEPTVTVSVSAGDGTSKLLVGRVEGGDEANYYVKKPDEPFKYEVSSYTGKKLDASLDDIRSKTPRTFDQQSITEVRFAGETGVTVRKTDDGSWELTQPNSDESLNDSKLESHLGTIAELRVKGFPDLEPGEVGLGSGADKLVAVTEGKTYTLLLGDEVEGGDDRYVKFNDQPEVYTISTYTAGQLSPSVDDLTGESSPKGGPGKGMMGKGMGKGMNKMQKMRMMKKLKQRMQQRRGQ